MKPIRIASKFAVVAVVLALLCFASGAGAADSWGYDLGHDLMSPYCPGRTLATCPSPQAAELVQWIVLQEASGATKQEVLDQLVERFGDEILGAPKAEGFAIWAYVLPVLGFVAGGGLAFLALRRVVRGETPAGAPPLDATAAGAATGGLRAAAASYSASTPASSSSSSAAGASEDDEWARQVDAELSRRD